MSQVDTLPKIDPLALPGLLPDCRDALDAAEGFLGQARQAVAALIAPKGKVDGALLEREQFAAQCSICSSAVT